MTTFRPNLQRTRFSAADAILFVVLLAGVGACEKRAANEAPPKEKVSLDFRVRKIETSKACNIDLGREPSLREMAVKINGRSVEIPTIAMDGLPIWDPSGFVEIADSGNDVILLLESGSGKQHWTCLFRIRDHQVIERQLTAPGAQEAKVDRYLATLDTTHEIIPPEQMAKARLEERQRIEASRATALPRSP